MKNALKDKILDLLENNVIDRAAADQLIILANNNALSLEDLGNTDALADMLVLNLDNISPAVGDETAPVILSERIQDADSLTAPTMDMNQFGVLPQSIMENRKITDMQAIKNNIDPDQNNSDGQNDVLSDTDNIILNPLFSSSGTMITRPDSRGSLDTADTIMAFRDISGRGNNLTHDTWGMAGTVQRVMSTYQYADGFSTPNDNGRPNVRGISNTIFDQAESMPNAQGISNYLWMWGQFVDHDITLTKEGHDELYPISVPTGDRYFDPYGTGNAHIEFTRSGYVDGTGTDNDNPRMQENEITAFIDASNVYGSNTETQAFLRGEGGKMLIADNGLLPMAMGDRGPEFKAGDVRANENIGLLSLHTVFAREHNRIVDNLAQKNPDWGDERLYQTAKAVVEGLMQHITYTEFLPTLLGADALTPYSGYNADVNPQVSTEFSSAAFRVGHTMLSSAIMRLQEGGEESEYGHMTLQDAFFRPDIVMSQGIDDAIRGLASSMGQTVDSYIISDVRNFLFGPPGAGGFDLVSLNIQRGRDHGIADFNTVRESYGLERIESFDALTNDADLAQKLTNLYGSIDSLDLWVGGLIEQPYGSGIVGETFHFIIAEQFTALRDGDRFWYETRFDDELLKYIHETNLSDIIMNNTDIDCLQDDIFTMAYRMSGDDQDNNIIGTDNDDLIIGFGGDDVISGGLGNDTLYGGDGADTFVLSNTDHITHIRDFDSGEDDRLDISDILSGLDTPANDLSNLISITQDDHNQTHVALKANTSGNNETLQTIAILDNTLTLDLSDFIFHTNVA